MTLYMHSRSSAKSMEDAVFKFGRIVVKGFGLEVMSVS